MPDDRFGVGASLLRKEDDRHLHGRGQFVAGHQIARHDGRGVCAQPACPCPDPIDLGPAGGARPRLYRGRSAAHQADPRRHARDRRQIAALAAARHRQGALCRRGDRRLHCAVARRGGRPRQLPSRSISRCSTRWSTRRATCAAAATWSTSSGATTSISSACSRAATSKPRRARPKSRSRREYRMNRQSGAPLEGRGVLAYRDHRLDEVVVYASTQTPHTVRVALAEILDIEERRIRVVAPDVGGGFGPKARLYPEEIILAALALELDHPVRWIEDRSEHLLTAAHTRDHHYKVTAYADRQGRILGVDAEIVVDAGAYGLWPQGPYQEADMAARTLPGPYTIPNYRARTIRWRPTRRRSVPIAASAARARALRSSGRSTRSRARSGATRRGADREHGAPRADAVHDDRRHALRHRRLSRRACGSAPSCWICRRSARASSRASPTAGSSASALPPLPSRPRMAPPNSPPAAPRSFPGFESCTARILTDGSVVLMVGIQSHGQGLETTLSQIAAQELGIDPARISVRHGDTESTAFGFGTFASRSMVMSGGAVARASRMLRDKLCRIGAHLLQCDVAEVRCADGVVAGPQGSVTIAEIAKVAHLRMDGLPPGVDPLLDATATYEPAISTGVFSYATHGAVVAVDPETGFVELLDFAVAEDCGTMVNPMIVEGQIRGGVVQGIGTALYEEIPYDEAGQPLAGTFADYLLPGASEMPAIKIGHLHTPAPHTEYGMKGMGEGGAVAPPAAIANAVRDALSGNRRRSQRNPDHPAPGPGGNTKSARAGGKRVGICGG